MSDDVMRRAALARGDARAPAPLDRDKGRQLMARAQAVLDAPRKETLVSAPPPAPRAERVKLPVTCAARGVTYAVIAERRGDALRFVGHELPQPGGGTPRMPGHLSGQYRIENNGWACPLCSTGPDVWLCNCEAMQGAMHCLGSTRGQYRCACGRIEDREFTSARAVAVRGVAVGAAPRAASTATALTICNR